MLIPLMIFGTFIATTEVADHVKDNKLIEASKAAAAAGQHDLAQQLLCRAHPAKESKECKALEKKGKP